MQNDSILNIANMLDGIKTLLATPEFMKIVIQGCFTVFGVFLGVLLTMVKEVVVNRYRRNSYKLCIDSEIEILMKEAAESLRFLFKSQDHIIQYNRIDHFKSYASMSFICFDKFFPDIARYLNDAGKFRMITKIYSSARAADCSAIDFAKFDSVNGGREEFVRELDLIMSNFIHLYQQSDSYLNNSTYENELDIYTVCNKLKVQGPFFDKIKMTR